MWTSTRTVRATTALTLLAATLGVSGCSSEKAGPAPSTSTVQPTTRAAVTTPAPASTSSTPVEPPATAGPRSAPAPAPAPRRSLLTSSREVPAPAPATPEPSETTLVTRTPTPTSSEPTGTPTTAAGRTWLADLGSDGEVGPAPIAGQVYRRSISVSACTIYSGQPTYAFRLDGRYRTLRGVVGQDDGSESQKAVVQVTVRGDGRTLASRRAGYGTASPITVDVSGVQRLTVGFREVSCGTDGGAAAVLGAPRLIG